MIENSLDNMISESRLTTLGYDLNNKFTLTPFYVTNPLQLFTPDMFASR